MKTIKIKVPKYDAETEDFCPYCKSVYRLEDGHRCMEMAFGFGE